MVPTPAPLLEAWATALSQAAPFPKWRVGTEQSQVLWGAGQVGKSNQQARDIPGLVQA